MESLIEKKQCQTQYNDVIQCVKIIAKDQHPSKRPAYTNTCSKQFYYLGECIIKE